MSRLLVTRLFTSAMRPAITMNASRSSSMILRNARIQLEKSPMRFLASWGFKDPVDRKEIEFRVIRCIATHDKVDQSQVCFFSSFTFVFSCQINEILFHCFVPQL